jgi:hypothetical protein
MGENGRRARAARLHMADRREGRPRPRNAVASNEPDARCDRAASPPREARGAGTCAADVAQGYEISGPRSIGKHTMALRLAQTPELCR